MQKSTRVDIAPCYITRAKAAALLNVSAKYLANLASAGGGPPAYYVGPKSPRYRADELQHWMSSRRANNTTDAEQRGLR